MSMTAEELYTIIKERYCANDLIICDLHKPCKSTRRCKNILKHPLVDFDYIKDQYQIGKGVDTPSSVDGVTYTGNRFCFVEIKGWVDFLTHLKSIQKDKAIIKQAASYDLNKKLSNSLDICKSLSGINDLSSVMPITFILVTDIETESNGLAMLHSNLLRLSNPVDYWQEVCNRELKARLGTIPGNIPTAYITCREFDAKLAKLA